MTKQQHNKVGRLVGKYSMTKCNEVLKTMAVARFKHHWLLQAGLAHTGLTRREVAAQEKLDEEEKGKLGGTAGRGRG